MPKANNMYGVAYKPIHKIRNQHKHGNDPVPKSPIRSGLVNFLAFSETCKLKLAFITQIFICLSVLMVSTNVWAQDIFPTVDLSVIDTNGKDTVFNPDKDENLRITVTVSADVFASHSYEYVLKVDNNGIDIEIGSGLLTVTAEEPGIAREDWDGGDLSDGTYTIRVEVREPGGGTVWSDQESVTLDKVPPELSLGTDIAEFSPNGDRVLDTSMSIIV